MNLHTVYFPSSYLVPGLLAAFPVLSSFFSRPEKKEFNSCYFPKKKILTIAFTFFNEILVNMNLYQRFINALEFSFLNFDILRDLCPLVLLCPADEIYINGKFM